MNRRIKKKVAKLCQFFHRFLGVMQQGVTHFWRTAGIKHACIVRIKEL